MRTQGRALALCAALSLSGCEERLSREIVRGTGMPDAGTDADTARADVAPPVDPAALTALGRAGNALGAELFARLRTRPGNLAISPAALESGLAVLAASARGETAAQFDRVLHLEGTGEDARAAAVTAARRRWSVAPVGASTESAIGNRVFFGGSDVISPTLAARWTAGHGAAPLELPFARGEFARAPMDAWAADASRLRVDHIAPPLYFTAQTRPVLASVAYFRGTWHRRTEVSDARPAPFVVDGMTSVAVPTIALDSTYPYAETDGVAVVELAFGDSASVLDVVMPTAALTLAALEARFTPAALDRWLAALAPTAVSVTLPRVALASARELHLGAALQALGVARAFDPATSELGGTAAVAGARNLALQDVLHGVFVEFTERGAAPDAAFQMMALPGLPAVHGAAQFVAAATLHVDHPFLFVVRDRATGAILMLGRVTDPRPPRWG